MSPKGAKAGATRPMTEGDWTAIARVFAAIHSRRAAEELAEGPSEKLDRNQVLAQRARRQLERPSKK
jgi:hypothetical protein